MKYRYFFSAIQCSRKYSSFIRSCDLGVSDIGLPIEISFVTDTIPTKETIEKIENVLNNTQKEVKLGAYYRNVKFIKAEVVI